MDKINTGSMVAVLGLNKNWDKEADYAIVSNFFYAINKQERSNHMFSMNESNDEKKSSIRTGSIN
jgi:hypothetical protein